MMIGGNIFPESPFNPGHPTPPEKFKGRSSDINKIIRYMPKVINQGKVEHFFITGKRAMGKTSFVNYIGNKVEEDFNMLPIYASNEGKDKIEDLIQAVMEAAFAKLEKNSVGRKIIESFVGNIQEIKIAGSGISLKDKPALVENVKSNFTEFLLEINNNLNDKNGLFVIIDDINGLSKTPEFANWYKGLSDTIDFNDNFVPISFALVSYRENFDKLNDQNPSFTRIFHLIEIDNLDDADIKSFFKENFENYNIEFDDEERLNEMVYYSWGMPLAMQQIGEEVFWSVENNLIDRETVLNGILDAALVLGNKQIRSILNKIKYDIYEGILLKLGKNKLMTFEKSEIRNILSDDENDLLDQFLEDMRELGLIEFYGKPVKEEYSFTNRLYFVYFLIIANLKIDKWFSKIRQVNNKTYLNHTHH